jgi:hypothetical protein
LSKVQYLFYSDSPRPDSTIIDIISVTFRANGDTLVPVETTDATGVLFVDDVTNGGRVAPIALKFHESSSLGSSAYFLIKATVAGYLAPSSELVGALMVFGQESLP